MPPRGGGLDPTQGAGGRWVVQIPCSQRPPNHGFTDCAGKIGEKYVKKQNSDEFFLFLSFWNRPPLYKYNAYSEFTGEGNETIFCQWSLEQMKISGEHSLK